MIIYKTSYNYLIACFHNHQVIDAEHLLYKTGKGQSMEIRYLPLYEKLSKAALAMPEAYEKLMHGTPAFYVEKKFFVRLKEDGETIALYTGDRDCWMARNNDTFFINDHYKDYPMLLVDLKTVSNEELAILIKESWKLRAPKRVVKAHGIK